MQMYDLTKLVRDKPKEAKKTIREAFARGGYDYFVTAKALGCHHYTLRRHARTLGITQQLVKDRQKAIARGERVNDAGRPRKAVPAGNDIVKAFARNGYTMNATAEALGVSVPTLRSWVRQLGIGKQLASTKKGVAQPAA